MTRSFATTLAALLAASTSLTAQAHMQMVSPIPFNSPHDAAYYGDKIDYSMTSPLFADGSNYPCKGYHLEGMDKVQATYTPGQSYNISLAGTATHDGGSCQVSLSYDNGKTFHVIKSMVGGCPLKLDWDFTVPTTAPASGNALLAWTWFNLVGNREMYMNCARVAIKPQSAKLSRGKGRRAITKDIAVESLPDNFACNIGNGCETLEGHEVIFPNPGQTVEIGKDAVAAGRGPGFMFLQTNSTPTGNSFYAGTISPTYTYSVPAMTTAFPIGIPQDPTPYANSVLTSYSATNSVAGSPNTFVQTTFSTKVMPSTPSGTVVCTPGNIRCDTAYAWSMCVPSVSGSGDYVFMGSVAPGTTCTNGVIGARVLVASNSTLDAVSDTTTDGMYNSTSINAYNQTANAISNSTLVANYGSISNSTATVS